MCAIVTIMIVQYTSLPVDMRTLLDRKNFSSRTNGQVAARRVIGLKLSKGFGTTLVPLVPQWAVLVSIHYLIFKNVIQAAF